MTNLRKQAQSFVSQFTARKKDKHVIVPLRVGPYRDVTKTGNGEWGMGNEEWGMGNGEWKMGNGEWGMGNGKWGMGNGEWEMGN